MSLIVTNKWLRAGYGEPLRRLLSTESWVQSIVDFGHAKQIFPDADVFPCILLTRKPSTEPPPATSKVCVIPREQLRIEDLSQQIETSGFDVQRQRLADGPWSLEPPAEETLMDKIRKVGKPLSAVIGSKPLRGILTGLNEAFLLDAPTKERLVKEDPKAAELLRPFVRGQDIDRWRADWAGLWMLAMKSSGDHSWPWKDSGEKAEEVFAAAYPSIYHHLQPYKDRLIQRQDKGKYWWELRSCAYWRKFDVPRIIYQEIQYHPCYALGDSGLLGNNKTFFLQSADLYLLAVLNSPLMWWFNWRHLPHMKDEALTPVAFKMEELPIAVPNDVTRKSIEAKVTRMLEISGQTAKACDIFLDWLRMEYDVTKPSTRLQSPADLTEDTAFAEVKRARGKGKTLTPTSLRVLKDGIKETLEPLHKLAAETVKLERSLSDAVNETYALSAAEVALLWQTAPPRMPLSASST